MEEGLTTERCLELGERNLSRGELDRAVHYFNLVLKSDISSLPANLALAEAYIRKADGCGPCFFRLAREALGRALAADPENEAAHEKLVVLAYKSGEMDSLAREYGAKARSGPGAAFYARHLKRLRAFALLDRGGSVQLPEYRPVLFMKALFDFILLPSSSLAIVIGNMGGKYKPLLPLGMTLFACYCAYRAIIFFLTRRR